MAKLVQSVLTPMDPLEETAESYIRMHTKRLQQFGIGEVRATIFDVNRDLTAVTKGPAT